MAPRALGAECSLCGGTGSPDLKPPTFPGTPTKMVLDAGTADGGEKAPLIMMEDEMPI